MSGLTKRQREVAALVAVGMSNKEIARELRLSEGTVKLHLHHVYERLGFSNRTRLMRLMMAREKLTMGE